MDDVIGLSKLKANGTWSWHQLWISVHLLGRSSHCCSGCLPSAAVLFDFEVEVQINSSYVNREDWCVQNFHQLYLAAQVVNFFPSCSWSTLFRTTTFSIDLGLTISSRILGRSEKWPVCDFIIYWGQPLHYRFILSQSWWQICFMPHPAWYAAVSCFLKHRVRTHPRNCCCNVRPTEWPPALITIER